MCESLVGDADPALDIGDRCGLEKRDAVVVGRIGTGQVHGLVGGNIQIRQLDLGGVNVEVFQACLYGLLWHFHLHCAISGVFDAIGNPLLLPTEITSSYGGVFDLSQFLVIG